MFYALINFAVPTMPSPAPLVASASTQPTGSGDIECFGFFGFRALDFPSMAFFGKGGYNLFFVLPFALTW